MNSYKFPFFVVLVYLVIVLLLHDTAGDFLAASGDDRLPSLIYGYRELVNIALHAICISFFGWAVGLDTKTWVTCGVMVFVAPFFGMVEPEKLTEASWVVNTIGWSTGTVLILMAIVEVLNSLDRPSGDAEETQPRGGQK